MLKLYRCPSCYSVLKRNSEIDEIIVLSLDKSTYECSACGAFISAKDVLSGKYDISTELIENEYNNNNDKIISLKFILSRLRAEHQPNYVYRGQIRIWPKPLLPAIYRGFVDSKISCKYTPEMRLREVGKTFYELIPFNQENKMQHTEVLAYLRHLFGYPLSNLLAQQCGIQSEGLDVTSDPDIAAFFAIYDFESKSFSDHKDEPGIIYRFKVPLEKLSLQDIKKLDFYTCPTYLSALDILKLFGYCNSWDEALESFLNYVVEYGTLLNNSSSASRPIDILKLPAKDILGCRVIQQKAGLLFPDMLLSNIYTNFVKAPPSHKTQKEGMTAIEDIDTRAEVNKFLFEHSYNNSYCLKISPDLLLPRNDPFLMLLNSFLSPGIINQFIFITENGIVSNPNKKDLLK